MSPLQYKDVGISNFGSNNLGLTLVLTKLYFVKDAPRAAESCGSALPNVFKFDKVKYVASSRHPHT